MEKQKNIPELRFPDAGNGWEKVKLEEIATFLDGRRKPIKESERAKMHGAYPYYGASGIIDYVNDYIFNEDLVLLGEDGANIITRSTPLAFRVSGKCWINNHAHVLKSKSQNDIDFLAISLERITYEQYNTGTAQPKLNQEVCQTIPLYVPPLPEQQKIASFFTAIDKKISQLKQKKTLLEQYKKGVMQKIFSQQIRFRDENGQEFPKWVNKRLGEIGKTYNGLTGKSKEDFGSGMPYIQYKQIFDDSKIDTTRFGLVSIHDGENQSKTQYGDVFFTTSSETPDEVGTASVLLDEIEDVYLNSFCFGYRSSLEHLLPEFSRYLFRNEIFRNEIVKLAQGSTRYNISKNELMKLELALPTIREQTKIANFLSAIDTKINHTQTQLENAERWKKGLLQKMFV